METPKRVLRNLHHANVQQANTPFQVPASPLLKSLGYGTGVNVYYLERSPRSSGQIRSPWAIKRVSNRVRLNNKESSKLFNERIVKEAEILKKLQHPNIVGFRGIQQGVDGIGILALECCNSSLGMILENRLELNHGALPACHVKKMMLDVSSALDYLHCNVKILHGDLKSHNVLVKKDFEICKLCDFGVSVPLNEDGVLNFSKDPNVKYVGTDLWCAPEVINEEEIIDSKAEIFSFGLIIYETIALVPPHTLEMNDSVEDETSLLSVSDESIDVGNLTPPEIALGTRPPLPQAFDLSDEYNVVLELFYLCTNSAPEERPSAKVIHDSLKKEVDTK